MSSSSFPVECANCGSPLPRAAKACPQCGADDRTGWHETDVYDGLDLPDEAWADHEAPPARNREISWYWWVTGIGLFLVLILTVLGLR